MSDTPYREEVHTAAQAEIEELRARCRRAWRALPVVAIIAAIIGRWTGGWHMGGDHRDVVTATITPSPCVWSCSSSSEQHPRDLRIRWTGRSRGHICTNVVAMRQVTDMTPYVRAFHDTTNPSRHYAQELVTWSDEYCVQYDDGLDGSACTIICGSIRQP